MVQPLTLSSGSGINSVTLSVSLSLSPPPHSHSLSPPTVFVSPPLPPTSLSLSADWLYHVTDAFVLARQCKLTPGALGGLGTTRPRLPATICWRGCVLASAASRTFGGVRLRLLLLLLHLPDPFFFFPSRRRVSECPVADGGVRLFTLSVQGPNKQRRPSVLVGFCSCIWLFPEANGRLAVSC